MTPEAYQRASEIFSNACDLEPDRRAAYLDNACDGDAEVRSCVEAMLKSDEEDDAFMTDAGLQVRAQVDDLLAAPAADEPIPASLGRYRIIRKLGDGGMGVVYLAEQDNPRRSVAVKVIRPGLMSSALLRRFEFEAHVLGQLRHPGIAHIYDAGTAETDRGRHSYFAMEYVDGLPLDQHIREQKLGTRACLTLVTKICDAVHYAHQKGIIHRDLKPGNILVVDSGQPKVLDFGVARATNSDTQTATLQTNVGQLIGTIPYMSPEQVGGVPTEIDTRSDVYALGVIIFQLLTQQLPHSLRDRSIAEAARIIRDDEPTRLGTIQSTLRGDVETIVSKALEKEKARRYQSAAELAGDIRRYLLDEPIEARPASTMYQLGKFAKRHKGLVGGVIATIIVLIIGTGVASWFAWRASVERDNVTKARDLARIETARAEAINDFLVNGILGAADPELGLGQGVTVLQAVESSAPRIPEAFAKQPEVESVMHATIGTLLGMLGRYDLAEAETRKAVAMLSRQDGAQAPSTLSATIDLGLLLIEAGANEEAHRLLAETLTTLRAQSEPNGEMTARALNGVGHIQYHNRDLEDALTTYRQVHDIHVDLYGANDPRSIRQLGHVGNVLYNLKRREESVVIKERVYALELEVHGEDHPATSRAQHDLAVNYYKLKRYAEAAPLFKRCLAARQQRLGPDHPAVADTMYQYGRLLVKTNRLEDARQILESALAIQRKKFSRDHEYVAKSLNALGFVHRRLGDHKAAEAVFIESHELYLRTLGQESEPAAISKLNIGTNLYYQERFAEAEPVFRAAVELNERVFDPGDWRVANGHVWLGRCMTKLGRFDEARQSLNKGHRIMIEAVGEKDKRTQDAARYLRALDEFPDSVTD